MTKEEFVRILRNEIVGVSLYDEALRVFRYSKEVRKKERPTQPGIDLAAHDFLYAVTAREIDLANMELLLEVDVAQMMYGLLVMINDAKKESKTNLQSELQKIFTELLKTLWAQALFFSSSDARTAFSELYLFAHQDEFNNESSS